MEMKRKGRGKSKKYAVLVQHLSDDVLYTAACIANFNELTPASPKRRTARHTLACWVRKEPPDGYIRVRSTQYSAWLGSTWKRCVR